MTATNKEHVRETVRSGYAAIAEQNPMESSSGCCGGSSCCGPDSGDNASMLAQAIGYAEDDLSVVPEGSNMGLSCGNPTALAELSEGEVVVDLGSGGGFDVFIAARRVGARGRAVGVDMTAQMLSKARRNAEAYRERTGLNNVEFRLGEIEALPLPDNFADVVISNCVINLSPEKSRVWKEIARVLKPGGRVAVSDLALVNPLPESIQSMVEALVGCIAGAELISETERVMREAGLSDIAIHRKDEYVDAMTQWKDPLYEKIVAALPEGAKVSDYITSADFSARKG